MNRLFRTVKSILLYLIVPIVIAGSSFVNVSAEDGLTVEPVEAASVDMTNLPVVEATPEPELTYTYNEATGLWDSNAWYYDPVLGSYQPVPPVVESVSEVSPISEPAPDVAAQNDCLPEAAVEEAVLNNVDVDNTIESDATTGDASVLTNTEAGSAESGDASSIATVLNNVNSVTDLSGSNSGVATFSADVVGDVSGDIVLQPIITQALGNPITPNDTIANITNLNSITNDINLNATSGDAIVADNTKAGDALTGSADVVASIINVVNSLVVAGWSFVGSINIYGNLIGNILISPDFVPKLLASNGSTETIPKTIVVNASDTIDIINNLSLSATSGQASVLNNTQAGNAITGDAQTNLVIFNMTGHDIVASNCLLVFINVLGEWYGVIIGAPAGATAAVIGNGVESDFISAPSLNVTSANKTEIVNNITLASQSGDAAVTGNTLAGNAVSGNATASLNLANIVGSRFSLSGWFGLLFINVFGKWFGNFGIEAKSTTPVVVNPNDNTTKPVIEFVPRVETSTYAQPDSVLSAAILDTTTKTPIVQNISEPEQKVVVLGAVDEASPSVDYILMLIIAMVVLMMASILWLGIQRLREARSY
jgi:hypothetical protein